MTTPGQVWHGHWSLRFDADPVQVARALADLTMTHGLDLLTADEARSRKLMRELRKALPATHRASRTFEYLYVWDTRVYRSRWPARLQVLDPRSWPMFGGHRKFRVARKRFTHRASSTRLRADVFHGPSGVDGGPNRWSGDSPSRVKISQRGFRREGRSLRRYAKRHPHGAAVIHADTNLNQFGWRTWTERTLWAESVWTLAGFPTRGTHGLLRLIDTAHVLGVDVDRAAVVVRQQPRKLDHRPIVYRALYDARGDR